MNLIHLAAESGSEPPGGLAGWAIGLMETLGGPGAGLAIALENLFPPLPSEVILPLAGFTASQGDMSLASALIWTTAGSVVGAIVLYYVGALLGRERTRAIAARLPLVKMDDIDKTEAWFIKHGVKAVFFGRMVPIFRSFISIPAGVERMSIVTFVLFTTLGSLIWNTIFVVAGYQLGENWHIVDEYAGVFSRAVVVAVLVAVVVFVVLRVRKNRRLKAQGIDPATEEPADPERTQIIVAEDTTQTIERYRER
ncbi:membrane protein DedA with SNARE-associated domain [Actinoalloteichus hoggarensis]|uniref:Inner membrane protein YqjA n=1 Tax=Actinoalloteichus hoggarensis TaxID=1470176 RepID=A0A221VYK2_9PSEU|nr:DedA family protein [Actinoalloteichus hoggarensis]ASO18622.1 Inner membrane protein YqjA [Actinoalloteichus hoggarensis]MBB5921989.1 membrane protein DedA with SNARE-associated domain [Actinoalloteichus hoggarensis]